MFEDEQFLGGANVTTSLSWCVWSGCFQERPFYVRVGVETVVPNVLRQCGAVSLCLSPEALRVAVVPSFELATCAAYIRGDGVAS